MLFPERHIASYTFSSAPIAIANARVRLRVWSHASFLSSTFVESMHSSSILRTCSLYALWTSYAIVTARRTSNFFNARCAPVSQSWHASAMPGTVTYIAYAAI
eukprot:2569866-Rhodomonas_salina.2